jgi:hypothetical protein
MDFPLVRVSSQPFTETGRGLANKQEAVYTPFLVVILHVQTKRRSPSHLGKEKSQPIPG